MAQKADTIQVFLEIGESRAFAGAVDWPGWCRSGRDEAGALKALFDYGPRYARAIEAARLGFGAPLEQAALVVVERVAGNTTTNFGAPGAALSSDEEPAGTEDLRRWEAVLEACWRSFDAAVEAARGKELSKGPRGGGRDLEKIVGHVREAQAAYLSALGGKLKIAGEAEGEELKREREAILTTLAAAARGEVPRVGPRGGMRWTPRFFVRRAVWHVLDHAWEVEDRAG